MVAAGRNILCAGILLASLIYQATATAGSFQIVPVRIALSAQESTAVLTVHNNGAEASVMQLETNSWSQAEGKDRYAATREILATPPVFTIPAGGSQIVRVGMRRQADSGRELAYRIFLQEVPTETNPKGQVRIALRFGIPVFVAPASQTAKSTLEWRVATLRPGRLRIEAINRGNIHVQITGFSLGAANGSILAEHDGMNYLLPGQSHNWVVTPNHALPPGIKLKIVARTDGGEIQTEVLPER